MAYSIISEEDRRKHGEQVPDATQVAPSAQPASSQHPSGRSLIDIYDERGARPNFLPTFEQAATPQPTAQTSAPRTALETLRQAMGDAQQAEDAARDSLTQAEGEYRDALDKHKSAYNAVGELLSPANDPKFGEQETKRERNRAIATALGNLFSNLAGSIMAGTGTGLGYVPKMEPNRALARLSELEKEWLTRGEKFRTWRANSVLDAARADVTEKAAGVKTAKSDLSTATKNKGAAKNAYIKEQSKVDSDQRKQEGKEKTMAIQAENTAKKNKDRHDYNLSEISARGEQTRQTNAQRHEQRMAEKDPSQKGKDEKPAETPKSTGKRTVTLTSSQSKPIPSNAKPRSAWEEEIEK